VSSAEPVVIAGKRHVPRRAGNQFEVTFTLIETRGEGGLFLCAPSPGYEVEQGTFENIPVLNELERAVVLAAACTLNEAIPAVQPIPSSSTGSGRPGDDFNERGNVRDVLLRHGWQLVHGGQNEYWRRPGKDGG